MILVSQGADRVFFTDDECHIAVKHEQIVFVRNGKSSVLGEYCSEERAREVFYEAVNEMMSGATGLFFKGE